MLRQLRIVEWTVNPLYHLAALGAVIAAEPGGLAARNGSAACMLTGRGRMMINAINSSDRKGCAIVSPFGVYYSVGLDDRSLFSRPANCFDLQNCAARHSETHFSSSNQIPVS